MRLLVCGGRDFTDRERVFAMLDKMHAKHGITTIIEGGQRTRDPVSGNFVGGADWFANQWAWDNRLGLLKFDADWAAHGKAAGPIRNQRMIDDGKPTHCLAFPGGRGTANMVALAKAAGVPTHEVDGS